LKKRKIPKSKVIEINKVFLNWGIPFIALIIPLSQKDVLKKFNYIWKKDNEACDDRKKRTN